jgi:hypothetical protein
VLHCYLHSWQSLDCCCIIQINCILWCRTHTYCLLFSTAIGWSFINIVMKSLSQSNNEFFLKEKFQVSWALGVGGVPCDRVTMIAESQKSCLYLQLNIYLKHRTIRTRYDTRSKVFKFLKILFITLFLVSKKSP